MMFDLFLGGKT